VAGDLALPTDEDIHNALLAIHSRLNTIDGKVTLVARADRDRVLEVLEEAVRRSPLVGHIYLLLDGKRSQRQIFTELKAKGVSTSEATISRRMADMASEFGIAEYVITTAAGKIYRKNREMESVLNLTTRIERWLDATAKTKKKAL
jgi:hypothetical protein